MCMRASDGSSKSGETKMKGQGCSRVSTSIPLRGVTDWTEYGVRTLIRSPNQGHMKKKIGDRVRTAGEHRAAYFGSHHCDWSAMPFLAIWDYYFGQTKTSQEAFRKCSLQSPCTRPMVSRPSRPSRALTDTVLYGRIWQWTRYCPIYACSCDDCRLVPRPLQSLKEIIVVGPKVP